MSKKRKKNNQKETSFIAKACLVTVIFLLIFLPLKLLLWDIPLLLEHNPKTTALMSIRGDNPKIVWVEFKHIPHAMKKMIVTSEDARFFEHEGVDWTEIKNVIKESEKTGRFSRGASTITMQLARNLYLSPEKSLVRKVIEIVLAHQIDLSLPKERILEIYLNIIEWDQGVYGLHAAAKHHFKKNPRNLTLNQMAFLVAIMPNPKEFGRWPPTPYISKRMATIKARAGY